MGKMVIVAAIVAAIAIISSIYNKIDQKKQAELAEQKRAAEEQRKAEEARKQAEIAEAKRLAEEKLAAEAAERQRLHEEKVKAYEKAVAEIVDVPVDVSDAPAPKLSVSLADGLKYSTITKRTPLAGIGNFVALDVETTGLRPTQGEIVDVAAIRFRDFEPVEKFESLCFPRKGVPEETSKVNGITSDMVEGRPTFQQVAQSLQAFIGTDNLVGHNLPFDLSFIGKYGVDFTAQKRKYFDTLDLARKTLKKDSYRKKYDREYDCYEDVLVEGDVPDFKLVTLCQYYGIINPESHRAFGDALAAGRLFHKLVEARS